MRGVPPCGESRTTPCWATCTRPLLGLRNDVGLLSEEWDPAAQRQLGNFPQAFSHFALVVSALQLHTGRAARSDSMSM